MIMAEMSAPLALAHDRTVSGYEQGSLSDGRMLGVALHSGGAAGINALGISKELKQRGVFNVADILAGDSIGGVNAGIIAADQIEDACEAFYSLKKQRFVNPWRAARIGGRVMDMDILAGMIGEVLDTGKITDSPIPIDIGVTRLRPFMGMSVDISKVEPEEVIPWMMRGAHVPVAGGAAPRDKYGTPYADAGVAGKGPIMRLLEAGCTDIISVACNPNGIDIKRRWQIGVVGVWSMRHDPAAIFKLNKAVDDQLANRRPFQPSQDGAIENHTVQIGNVNVVSLYPPTLPKDEKKLPKLYTTDPGRLRHGFEKTAEYMRTHLAALMPELRPATA